MQMLWKVHHNTDGKNLLDYELHSICVVVSLVSALHIC
jgi:hypothetical protein